MKKSQLLALLNTADYPRVRDTHDGKVYGLRGLITMLLPDGRAVDGMMMGNNQGEHCRCIDDFADFEPA